MPRGRLVLFYPNVPAKSKELALETLNSRFIGQGPKVDDFEKDFQARISPNHKTIAVNSGTSALHLAYVLAGIKDDDQVIAPVFTCTATHTPLLYQRAKILFADVQEHTLNIDPKHVRSLMTDRVKAIVCVHYGGLPCDMDELHAIAEAWKVPVIEDAAQAIGASYKGQNIGAISQFTAFSFQAVKTLTTIDGGMLCLRDHALEDKAKRLRWFGIDRQAKFEDRWSNDIWEVGYKYQMTDVSAAMGIGALQTLSETLAYQRRLFHQYQEGLKGVPGIKLISEPSDRVSSCWLATAFVENRNALKTKLAEYDIESNPCHYRCDRYTIFGGRVKNCPNMDALEEKYLLLPMHSHLSLEDVQYVCETIKQGW